MILLYWNIMSFWRFWVYGLVNQMEDVVLCENVQRGLESPAYDKGRYALVEKAMHHFHCLLHQNLKIWNSSIYIYVLCIYDTNECKSTLVPYMFICSLRQVTATASELSFLVSRWRETRVERWNVFAKEVVELFYILCLWWWSSFVLCIKNISSSL